MNGGESNFSDRGVLSEASEYLEALPRGSLFQRTAFAKSGSCFLNTRRSIGFVAELILAAISIFRRRPIRQSSADLNIENINSIKKYKFDSLVICTKELR